MILPLSFFTNGHSISFSILPDNIKLRSKNGQSPPLVFAPALRYSLPAPSRGRRGPAPPAFFHSSHAAPPLLRPLHLLSWARGPHHSQGPTDWIQSVAFREEKGEGTYVSCFLPKNN